MDIDIDRQMAEIKENIREVVKETTRELTWAAVRQLWKDAPVYAGVYINSFTISFDQPVYVERNKLYKTTWDGIHYRPMPLALQLKSKNMTMKREIGKLKGTIKPFTSIYISNGAGHAPIVEYVGWKVTRPKFVFERATDYVKGRAPALVRKATKRVAQRKKL